MYNTQKFLTRFWSPTVTGVRRYHYPPSFMHILKDLNQPEYTQLDNGLMVATLERQRCLAHIGLYADGGSRYEHDRERGVTHFFEHLVFKSTHQCPRDKLQSIINCLGIQLHAHTTRQMVSYTADCLAGDLDEVTGILANCVFNNSIDSQTIQAEKCIVMEEMQRHDRDPSALVFDYLHATAFQGTGLANTILGTCQTVSGLDPGIITPHLNRVLTPSRMCLCAVGGVDHQHVVDLANKYLRRPPVVHCFDKSYRYTGSDVRYRNDAMPKACVAYALEGPAFNNLDSMYIDLACVLIGGWDLTQLGGEEHGVAVARRSSLGKFCDAYKAFHLKYKDTSLWGVEFVSASLDQEDMLFTIQDIMMGLCSIVVEGEFERAKEEMKSKLLYKTQSCSGAALDIATHMLFNCYHCPSLHERVDFLDRIRLEDFKKTVYEYIYNKCPVVAAVGPTEGLPDYNRIRAGMYWMRI